MLPPHVNRHAADEPYHKRHDAVEDGITPTGNVVPLEENRENPAHGQVVLHGYLPLGPRLSRMIRIATRRATTATASGMYWRRVMASLIPI